MVASSSEAAARARAAAHAMATLPAFLRNHPPRLRAIATADSADVQVLARLVRLYSGALPMLWTAGTAAAGACVAWAKVGDWTAVAIAADEQTAAFEALGDSLSAFQLGRLTDRQAAWPLSALRTVAALPAGEVAAASSSPSAIDAVPALAYVAAGDPCIPADLHVGHARVTAA